MQQVTVNVSVVTVAGVAAAAATLKITLAGYGSVIPELVGGEVLGGVQIKAAVPANGNLAVQLWGNDVISPSGTFYCFQMIDAKGNVVAATNYLLVGQGALNLSSLLPYDPTLSQGIFYVATLNNQGPAGPPGGVAGEFTPGVVPTGAIDGNNATFTVPGNPQMRQLFLNGQLLEDGTDYTWVYTSANLTTLTYAAGRVPQPGNAENNNVPDNHIFYGYSSANLETEVTALVNPIVAAAVQSAVANTITAAAAAAVTAALNTQLAPAVTSQLIAAGLLPMPPSLAITGSDGVVYLIQSFYDQLRAPAAASGTSGAPSSYPIQDATGKTYQITVGAGGQINPPTQVSGVTGAPLGYSLQDPDGKTNVLQVEGGQLVLTAQAS